MTKRMYWVVLLALVSCQKVKGLEDGALKFAGINALERTVTGSYMVTWPAAEGQGGTISYDVYVQDLGTAVTGSDGTLSTLGETSPRLDSGRYAFVVPVGGLNGVMEGDPGAGKGVSQETGDVAVNLSGAQLIEPQRAGKLLKTLSAKDLRYEIDTRLRSDHAYAIQVVARDDRGQGVASTRIGYLSAVAEQKYQGCIAAQSAGAGRIRLEVEYLPGFEKITVLRDGQVVSEADTPEARVIFDEGLVPGRQYTYECQGMAASEILVGANKLVVTADNPFDEYQGCVKANVGAGGTAEIQFQFPEGATKVSIYRDGELRFETTTAAQTTFTDAGLKSGQTYTYRCEAENIAAAQSGQKELTLTVPDLLKDFEGCVDARPLGASEVQVTISYPAGIDGIKVLRDGIEVRTITDPSETTIIDSGLLEGQTYRYNCAAVVGTDSRLGKSEIPVTTLTSNPPSFTGISQVTVQSPRTAKVEWGVPTASGVAAAYFNVYATPGNAVDWQATPVKTVTAGNLFATIENLGDELPYAFGVRACSARDICDANTKSLNAVLPDGGAPFTLGAAGAVMNNGKVVLNVPWKAEQGAVAKRYVYRKTGATESLDLNDYTLVLTRNVDSVINPPVSIEFGAIQEHTTYRFVVVDEDALGQKTTVTRSALITTGDLTAPSFSGVSSLERGTAGLEDRTLKVNFIATTPEDPPGSPGAISYLIYLLPGGGNACASGALHLTVDATAWTSGATASTIVEGLQPKTLYGVCVKARDLAGNVSNTSSYLQRSTLDLTPPTFDGVQSVVFNKNTGKIDLSWNPSLSSDILEYRIKLWRNTASPAPGAITTLVKSHGTQAGGYSVTSGDFAFAGGDQVYVTVQACDNAATLDGGAQNCSPADLPFVYPMPDITPPQGFDGIKSKDNLGRPAQGQILVKWKPPTFDPTLDAGIPWTDYRGFIVYKVDNLAAGDNATMTLLKICPCSANHCPNKLSECLIEGLEARRTYNLHVRAYDANDNITTYLSPGLKTTTIRTTDTTPPTFASGLTAVNDEGTVKLEYTAAQDNQAPNELGATIKYQIYRKQGAASFIDPLTPETDGSAAKIAEVDATTYRDEDLDSNVMYHYTVCAIDTVDLDKPVPNRKCDGVERSVLTPDVEAPTITNFTSSKLADATLKKWNLTWTITDNSPLANVTVSIKYKISDSSTPPQLESEYTADTSGSAATLTSRVDLVGPANQNRYIHYFIKAQDTAGMKATAVVTVYSENEVTVTNVQRSSGSADGDKLIVLEGSGFVPASQVKVGLLNCEDIELYSSQSLGCRTPAQAPGVYAISVVNPDSSGSVQLATGYTYVDPLSPTAPICDTAAGALTASFAAGDGSAGAPYIICNAFQLDLISDTAPQKYFELGDNIDLNELAATGNNLEPITSIAPAPAGTFWGAFDGKNHYIANFRHEDWTRTAELGLFRRVYRSPISNLNVVKARVHGRRYVGILAGSFESSSCGGFPVTNIFVQGRLRAESNIAGGVAGLSSADMSNIRVNVDAAVADTDVNDAMPELNNNGMGGIVGHLSSGCSIEQASVEGSIINDIAAKGTTLYSVGGLVGYAAVGSVIDDVQANVTVKNTNFDRTAGVVGFLQGVAVTNAVVAGDISGRAYVGGVLGTGYMDDVSIVVEDNVVSANVKGIHRVGGIVGFHANRSLQVRRNTFSGKAEATSSYAGGIVSGAEDVSFANGAIVIEDNVMTGYVKANEGSGGILSYNGCTVGACNGQLVVRRNRVSGIVEGTFQFTGGIVGRIWSADDRVQIYENVMRGTVKGIQSVGGVIGLSGGKIYDNLVTGTVQGQANVGGVAGWARTFKNATRTDVSIFGSNIVMGPVSSPAQTTLGGIFGFLSRDVGDSMPQEPFQYLSPSLYSVPLTGLSVSQGEPTMVLGVSDEDLKNPTVLSGYDFDTTTPVWRSTPNQWPRLNWE